MKEKNKIYTAADFARYHSGTMPSPEMHALEKAALEDPLLADALEGFVHAPAFESDIAELRERLTEKRKKKNVFFLSSFTDAWWRIAALFIIIGGAGYFFYLVNDSSKENSLATNEIKAPAEKDASADLVKNDSVTPGNNFTSENQQASTFEQKEKTALSPAKSQIEKEGLVSMQQAESVAEPSASRSKDGSDAGSEYVLKGKVRDEEGNAVPFASITDKTSNTGTVTDTAGRFSFRSQDSNITAVVSAAGYEPKSVTLKKDKEPTIEINKRDADLNAVVVTSKAKRNQAKESNSESKALNARVSREQITTGPQPTGGQDKFDQYLDENMVPVYDGNGERLKGEVLLSFTINKKGRPEKINVVKSSCSACETEAIRLLQNGPGWTGNKDQPGTVVIKFKPLSPEGE